VTCLGDLMVEMKGRLADMTVGYLEIDEASWRDSSMVFGKDERLESNMVGELGGWMAQSMG